MDSPTLQNLIYGCSLEIVHTPRRVERRVLFLEAQAAGSPRTRRCTSVAVQPELQTQAVHVVRQRLHPTGERDRVGHDVARSRVAAPLPAVVQVYVCVARLRGKNTRASGLREAAELPHTVVGWVVLC
jgi:hypothetical protein